MTTTRITEPTMITAGDRLQWTREFSGYPGTEYTVEYRFRGNGNGFDVTCVASGGSHAADVVGTITAGMTPGQYGWQAWATEIADATNSIMIASGDVTVKRGFAAGSAATAVDLRTPAKIMLDTIDAALLAFATSDVLEYEITTPSGSKKVKRSDKVSLTSQRKEWIGIVARENAMRRVRNGGPLNKTVLARLKG